MIVAQSLNVPIYRLRFHIIITGDFTKDYPEINKTYHQRLTEEEATLGMSQRRGGHILIIINVGKHRKVFKGIHIECGIADTISHESVHACNQLFESIGTKLDRKNDEPQAYLVGWFVNQITRNYLKFKEKENGKKV
jgi:hypothetical protein